MHQIAHGGKRLAGKWDVVFSSVVHVRFNYCLLDTCIIIESDMSQAIVLCSVKNDMEFAM